MFSIASYKKKHWKWGITARNYFQNSQIPTNVTATGLVSAHFTSSSNEFWFLSAAWIRHTLTWLKACVQCRIRTQLGSRSRIKHDQKNAETTLGYGSSSATNVSELHWATLNTHLHQHWRKQTVKWSDGDHQWGTRLWTWNKSSLCRTGGLIRCYDFVFCCFFF